MSNSEINKTLAKWLTKAKTMPAPPGPTERRGNVVPPQSKSARPSEPMRQLNLKISESTYHRIKGLAHRDRLSLVGMLDEMVKLYEQAHSKLENE